MQMCKYRREIKKPLRQGLLKNECYYVFDNIKNTYFHSIDFSNTNHYIAVYEFCIDIFHFVDESGDVKSSPVNSDNNFDPDHHDDLLFCRFVK